MQRLAPAFVQPRMQKTLVVLTLLCDGCIAASVRAHTGVLVDQRQTGFQAGVDLGIGIATTKHSAVVETIGVAAGTPPVGLAVGLDYVRLGESSDGKLAGRIGFGGIPIAYGDLALSAGLRAAVLYVLRDRESSSSGEKWGSEASRSVLAVGLEAAVLEDGYRTGSTVEATIGASAGVTLELLELSTLY